MAEPKNVQLQVAEINGKAKEYHSEHYASLMKKLLPIRKEFPKSKDLVARK